MNIINSFNYNFISNSIQKKVESNPQIEIVKSFSKNFNSNINIKSNVQKKNNTTAIINKKVKKDTGIEIFYDIFSEYKEEI